MATEGTGTADRPEIRDARDLRAFRLNRGLSQEAIAADVGITRRAWQRAESGLGVRPRHALAIANYVGRSVTELWPEDQG